MLTALAMSGLCAATFIPAALTTAATTPTPTPGLIGPHFDATTNPLTGLPLLDQAAHTRRPIVVKISNAPDLVRPQAGLGLADIVFEHYTEVGITRFSAIFLTHAPQRVGSIRSARLIDYELTPMYGALLAFSGASLGIDKRIYGTQHVIHILCRTAEDAAACARDVLAIGPAGDLPPSDFVERAFKAAYIGAPIYTRDEALPRPHNLFADLSLLWQRAAQRGLGQRPALSGLHFHPQPPDLPHRSGIHAAIQYKTTTAEWYYYPVTNRYYRSTDGERHFDGLTGLQIAADNVIILEAGHYLTDIAESGSGDNVHWSIQITLWPRGSATLLRDGRAYPVEWRRETRSDMLTFWTPDGRPMPLRPGQTWVQVVRTPQQLDAGTERIAIH